MSYKNETLNYYNKAFKEHGNTIKGLGWGSQEGQNKRFELIQNILLDYSNLNKYDGYEPISLLDVGCGFGGLYESFHFKLHGIKYLGIDLCQHNIEECHKKWTDSTDIFICSDLFDIHDKFDWVFGSGIFAVNSPNWTEDVQASLNKMIELANKGVVVNFLYGENKDSSNHFTSLSELDIILERCKIENFSLHKDYLDHDITLVVKK